MTLYHPFLPPSLRQWYLYTGVSPTYTRLRLKAVLLHLIGIEVPKVG